MNGEDMLRRIVEARELSEYVEEALSRAERPSINDAGEAYVMAKACADLLERIERDVRSEIAAGFVIESSTRLRGLP